MRKSFYTWFLILVLTLPAVSATPHWVKPGVYVKYAALKYEPYLEYANSKWGDSNYVYTMILFYEYKGVTYNINSNRGAVVEFKVLNDNGTHLRMRVKITAYNVTCTVFVKRDSKLPVFWNQSEVTSFSKDHNNGYTYYKIKFKNLSISGQYWIRKSDGMVVGNDGTVYGHTFLWYDPGENPSQDTLYLNMSPVSSALYFNGTSGEQRTLKVYYGKFGPPIGYLILAPKNPQPLKVCQINEGNSKYCPFGTGGPLTSASVLYDPFTGITISGDSLIFPPDLKAIGVIYALFSDMRGLYYNVVKHDWTYDPYLQLYDTNAQFQKVEEVPFSKARTPTKYVFYGSLILVGAVLGVKSSRGLKR